MKATLAEVNYARRHVPIYFSRLYCQRADVIPPPPTILSLLKNAAELVTASLSALPIIMSGRCKSLTLLLSAARRKRHVDYHFARADGAKRASLRRATLDVDITSPQQRPEFCFYKIPRARAALHEERGDDDARRLPSRVSIFRRGHEVEARCFRYFAARHDDGRRFDALPEQCRCYVVITFRTSLPHFDLYAATDTLPL